MTAAAALDDCDFWLQTSLLNEETIPVSKVNDSYEPEDEFFAKLTHRVSISESRNVSPMDLYTSPTVYGGSPQSTLGGLGSWSGRSSNGDSPPETPFQSQEDALGLIYEGMLSNDPFQASTEGQWRAVAKLNHNQQRFSSLQNHNADIYAVQQMKARYLSAVMQANQAALFLKQRLQDIRRAEILGVGSEVLNRSAWPALQQARAPMKPNFRAVPLQINESGGTGVFIPRTFDASKNVPPSKKSVVPCALVPSKVVQALNTSLESHPHCSQIPSGEAIRQHSFDALMARRHALLDQQQRSMMVKTEDITPRSLEACLPQEWSY